MNSSQPHKVLIIDDSRTIRAFLTNVLSADPRLEVVGCAQDAVEALKLLQERKPDVMTMDVEMPGMDGLALLRRVMSTNPLPVVMLSSITEKGSVASLDALEAGAVDVVCKRSSLSQTDMSSYSNDIVRRVVAAATVKVNAVTSPSSDRGIKSPNITVLKERLNCTRPLVGSLSRVVALGASTGGPEALRKVLTEFYSKDSAVLISQHMPERFMTLFAERLNTASRFEIDIASDGDIIEAGRGYVAPGGKHLEVITQQGKLLCKVSDEGLVNGHRPSVDVMFDSVCAALQGSALGVLLTGMGEDGARGLKKMHDIGIPTIVQDKQSSIVWGMPGTAFQLGAADVALPLDFVGSSLNELLGGLSYHSKAA